MTHPLGRISETSCAETRGARWCALEKSRHGFPIDTSLGICTLPVVQKVTLETIARGGLILRLVRIR